MINAPSDTTTYYIAYSGTHSIVSPVRNPTSNALRNATLLTDLNGWAGHDSKYIMCY